MLLGWALTVEPETIEIGSGLSAASETPFAVAFAKLTLPKSASGRTPLRLDGASAITSADASAADFSRCVVETVQCCVESACTGLLSWSGTSGTSRTTPLSIEDQVRRWSILSANACLKVSPGTET